MKEGLSFSPKHPFLGKARKVYITLNLALTKFSEIFGITIDQKKCEECKHLLIEINDDLYDIRRIKNPEDKIKELEQKYNKVYDFMQTNIIAQLEAKYGTDR